MTSDKVKAAAGRVRKMLAGANYRDVYGGDPSGWELDVDRRLLGDAYLAEHPADEDEPLAIEWCEASGVETRNLRQGDDWIPTVWCGDDNGWISLPIDDTRGDLRLLAKALGITLKEAKPAS